ncbi:MAG: hypothetical protein U5L07_09640 [Desulfobacterales bacterium]|nr:hypothetical protein [Desulfobacterales bacterium]
MEQDKTAGISFFEKNLTVWVVLCMVAGVLIGKFLPAIPEVLSKFEYAKVSIPIAVLIWLMIYPMMMKVDFASIKDVGKKPTGLFLTWVVNWLIKPFTMFGIAAFFSTWCSRPLFRRIWPGIIWPAPYFSGQPRVRPWSLSGAI